MFSHSTVFIPLLIDKIFHAGSGRRMNNGIIANHKSDLDAYSYLCDLKVVLYIRIKFQSSVLGT